MLVIKALATGYNFMFRELRGFSLFFFFLQTWKTKSFILDPRSDDYFLMDWIVYPVVIMVIYLKFVLHWGPNWMKNKEPFQLDNVLKVYNVFQILVNLYIFYLVSIFGRISPSLLEPVFSISLSGTLIFRKVTVLFVNQWTIRGQRRQWSSSMAVTYTFWWKLLIF